MWITFRKLSGALLLIGLVSVVANADPSVVRVVGNAQSGFHLVRDGQDYFIKGAGGSGSKKLLADYGGNSFRTWGSDTVASDLDEAQKYGLTVTEGMWLGHADQGFDWNNPDSIAKQRQTVTTAVIAGRDKPALLIWALGNEMEDGTDGADPVVWQEIENLARIVKKLDPNHPVMTVVAETNAAKVAAINRYCPDIDIVGINSYGGGSSVGARYLTDGGVKPYVVTEFGLPVFGSCRKMRGVWQRSRPARRKKMLIAARI